MQPIVLGPNMPEMFYRGGGRIDRLRGVCGHEDRPEDWIASVTSRFGAEADGMTWLPDGVLLAEAVAGDPWAWLGADHVARYGSDTGLLVKLLNAGQRLPVHVPPTVRRTSLNIVNISIVKLRRMTWRSPRMFLTATRSGPT